MTEDVFKDAINANPADMALRLVYADWLEEEGHCIEAAGHRWLVENGKTPRQNRYADWMYEFYFEKDHKHNASVLPEGSNGEAYPYIYSYSGAYLAIKIAATLIGNYITKGGKI